jgi:hypothetical protein
MLEIEVMMEVEVTDDSAEEPGNEPYPINIEMNGMDPGLMESDSRRRRR